MFNYNQLLQAQGSHEAARGHILAGIANLISEGTQEMRKLRLEAQKIEQHLKTIATK